MIIKVLLTLERKYVMNRVIFLKLELKQTLKLIPYLLAGATVLSAVIGSVAFCAGKILASSNKLNDKKTIVFSSEDDSEIVGMVVSSLSKSKSITTLFNIIETDYNDVADAAAKDETVVSVVIPKGFMYGLMNGKNYPIELYFSKTTSIYSLVITELSLAFQNTLKVAQAGVYTLYDYYNEQGMKKYAPAANTELNIIYLTKALMRENMFKPITLNTTGTKDIKTFYISSGIMVIILLLGCVFILRTKNTNTLISVKLRQHGIGFFTQSFVHVFCIAAALYTLFTGVLLTIFIINQVTHWELSFHFPHMMANGLAICICSSGIITLINSALHTRFSAILLLFISVITSCFISGAFIPSVLLPEQLNNIRKYLPTTYLLNTTGLLLKGDIYLKDLLWLLCYFLGFMILSVFFTYCSFKHSGRKRRTER